MRLSPRSLLLLLCLIGIVVLLVVVLRLDFVGAVRSYTWKKTPCQIVKSSIVEEPFSSSVTHFVLQVDYTYTFQGRDYRSTRFTTGEHQGSTDISKAQKAAITFAAGKTAQCYVNPRDPAEAVLERGELWGGLFLLAPLLIAGLVFHEEIFAWFESRRGRRRLAANLPLSDANDALRPEGRYVLFGIIGIVMGLFFTIFCLASPIWNWSRARSWMPAEAVIKLCELESRSGTHGPEYTLHLLYEYEFAGQRFQSGERNFGQGFDDSVAELTAWVAEHPPGTRMQCWVNPVDPTGAVLEKTFHLNWIPLSLGTLMLGFGGFMLAKLVQTRHLRKALHGARLVEYWRGEAAVRSRTLRVTPHPALVAALYGLGIFPPALAGAWSLQQGGRALLNGQGDLINLLYGAGAAIGAVACAVQGLKFARKAVRPLPVLSVSPGTPAMGERFTVEWGFRGGSSVRWIRLSLEGEETAKVRHVVTGYHGSVSDEKTEQAVFVRIPVAEARELEAGSGSVDLVSPPGMMHSFRGFKCSVNWKLKVEFGRHETETLECDLPLTFLPEKP